MVLKAECIVDQTEANKCEHGSAGSCPQPLGDADFYCPGAVTPKLCNPTGDEDDSCTLFPSRSCGNKRGCETGVEWEDENFQPIPCGGAPDTCA